MKTGYDRFEGELPPIYVTCPDCKTQSDEENVGFVNIEEDMQGADILTFVCPNCGHTVKSYRR